jgi:hypothetical protein
VNSWYRGRSGEVAIQSIHTTICYTVECDRCIIDMVEILARNQLLTLLVLV